MYIYGGGSLGASASTKIVLQQIISNPKKLFKPRNLISGYLSICVFAIFGYSNFKSPSSYRKWFTGAYLTGWHVKGYSSWSDSCFTIGVGWSSSFASAGLSKTYYSFAGEIFSNISNLYNVVFNKAKNLN